MNSIYNLLQNTLKDNLSIYFTAGYPSLIDTVKVIQELSKSKVDFIEVGLPYSDPLADGPTIQESSQKALQNGINLDIVFDQLLKYGEEKFCQKVIDCGIDTLILPDLPMVEYENHYKSLFDSYGINNVFLITPHTTVERILKIDSYTKSFIYMVASSAITGAKGEISQEQIDYFNRVNSLKLKSKLIIGFGISDHQTFSKACEYSNGAIIGSAFIKYLGENGTEKIGDFIKSVKPN